jgi:hypothetical protein
MKMNFLVDENVDRQIVVGIFIFLGGKQIMLRHFTLEYWVDDGWYVGRLKEIPGVFSQRETLQELEENIREVYQLMLEEED